MKNMSVLAFPASWMTTPRCRMNLACENVFGMTFLADGFIVHGGSSIFLHNKMRFKTRFRLAVDLYAIALEYAYRQEKEGAMAKYECPCGYVYDPEVGDPDGGIAPGTAFEDIPDDWVCPVCGLSKEDFFLAE